MAQDVYRQPMRECGGALFVCLMEAEILEEETRDRCSRLKVLMVGVPGFVGAKRRSS